MSKKNNGFPKDDYPSKTFFNFVDFEVEMLVKQANVKQNRFTVVFTQNSLTIEPEQ
jgi:hypothetical protein